MASTDVKLKLISNPVSMFICLFVCLFCQQELVEYYKQNTLGVSFPGLDTKLRRGVNEEHKGKGTDS